MQVTSKLMLAAAIALALAGPAAAHKDSLAPEFKCSNCKDWNQPQKPFKIHGNTWYVGTSELSALLITSPKGHILLDGALPQSAPIIEKNIKSLGFKMKDIKFILNSHAHFDHAGGIAALQKASGAMVAASAHGAQVLKDGVIGKDDPLYDPTDDPRIPKVAMVTGVGEGEAVRVGPLAVTAHLTPGHTPGSTTWSWSSCEKASCLTIVYADSLTPVAADNFRYTGMPADRLRASIAKVAALKCDIAVSTHPGFTDVLGKAAKSTPAHNAFIDPSSCRDYAAGADRRLDAKLATEQQPATAGQPGG
ncbi:MAG: subclass B3 metallo-beta-lactamase [Telluria sp.]|nr:subclass B3 metallo-beta-lactamase [Telluria sp.]